MYLALNRLRKMPSYTKATLRVACDGILFIVGVLIAWVIFDENHDNAKVGVGLGLAFMLCVYYGFGLYRNVLSESDPLEQLGIIVLGVIGGNICYSIFNGSHFWLGLVCSSVLTINLLIILRIVGFKKTRNKRQIRRIAIYGAGVRGINLTNAIVNSRDKELVFFVDDNSKLQGRKIRGKEVLSLEAAINKAKCFKIDELVLAVESLSVEKRQIILSAFSVTAVKIYKASDLDDCISLNRKASPYRPFDIDELLGRSPVLARDDLLAKNFSGESIMITGAGGSIGSEICRQICKLNPAKIILIDSSEHALYEIDRYLRSKRIGTIVPIIGNVLNINLLIKACVENNVTVIYHAAAYKHVPMVEQNVSESVNNNVFGSLNIAIVAEQCRVSKVVLVSSDKAVRPTNIMGATKRLCEMIFQARAALNQNGLTTFCMVRFGNVLGSSGSVVPLFKEQILEGGPITLTNKEITRYFMSIPEAAQLVIHSANLAANGDLFVLDMGNPVKIFDLAKIMIYLSGMTLKSDDNPFGDIEIKITGLRPGEKLHEELVIDGDIENTIHEKIFRVREAFIEWQNLQVALDRISHAVCLDDQNVIIRELEILVNGFKRNTICQ